MMDAVEQWLKVFALLGAGVFFAWKLFTGWLIINLKLSVKLERSKKNDSTDHLGITVTFEKGATDSIWLQHVSCRASWDGGVRPAPIDMSEELRWLLVEDHRIAWDQHMPSHGSIALSPGESTSFARATEVPTGVPITVQVAAYGTRNFWPRGFQWRASGVSLPLAAASESPGAADPSTSIVPRMLGI